MSFNLNPRALGLTIGLLSAIVWLLAMIFSFLTGVGETTLTTLGSFHPFFSYDWIGMIIIVVEHLIGGFIVGWIFAKVYNSLAK